MAGIGLFGLVENVQAAGEKCWSSNAYGVWFETSYNQNECTPPKVWSSTRPTTQPATPAPEQSEFEKQVGYMECGIINGDIWPGCVIQISYGLFYQVAAFILGLSAKFFNVLITITLSSTLFAKSTFIPTAWTVVRDLSNIFFILILLYIAVKIILDLGGSEAKKMIAKVIIIALLINFSMFFTQIVIDSSNILALIFYNKLDVCVNKNATTGECRPYDSGTDSAKTGVEEKDISGAMTNAFNPTSSLTWQNFFKQARTPPGYDSKTISEADLLPLKDTAGTMIALIFVSGAVMLFAAYAFFIAGISFLGRLIELWILIIFSPFAFMSFSVPLLEKVEYIGWDAWSKRLLAVSFMAPIFMFFMYFIFLLLKPPGLFGNLPINNGSGLMGAIQTILLFVIPALVILILLLQATKFAKKGSGVLGEKLISGAKIIGGLATGLALGVATGGAGVIGQASLGRMGTWMADSEKMKKWQTAEGPGMRNALRRFTGKKLRTVGDYASTSSFDARKGAIGGVLKAAEGVTGLKFGAASKILVKDGGFRADRKRSVEKRVKRADELKVGEDEKLTQTLHGHENNKQALLMEGSHDIEQLDNQIKAAQAADAAAQSALRSENAGNGTTIPPTPGFADAQIAAKKASDRVIELRNQKSKIKNATGADAFVYDAEAAVDEAAADRLRTAAETAQRLAATNPADAVLAKTARDATLEAHAATNKANATRAAARVAHASIDNGGTSINDLEDNIIPEAKHAIEAESKRRARASAADIPGMMPWTKTALRVALAVALPGVAAPAAMFVGPSGDTFAARREARHKIIMGAALDSGKK